LGPLNHTGSTRLTGSPTARPTVPGAADRVAEDGDPFRIDRRIGGQRVHRPGGVLDHASHQGPVGMPCVERRELSHAAAESGLVEGEHGVAGVDEREDPAAGPPVSKRYRTSPVPGVQGEDAPADPRRAAESSR